MSSDPKDPRPAPPGPQKTIMGYAPAPGTLPFAPAAQPPPPQAPAPQPQPHHQAQPQPYHPPQPQPQPYPHPPQAQPSTAPLVFPLHAGARGAFAVVGVLLILLIVAIPFAIWVFVNRSRGRLELHGSRIVTVGFLTRRWDLAEARRLGVLSAPILARGIGGALARRKVGGDNAVSLCMIDARGKKSNVLISTYERYPEIIAHAAAVTGLQVEPLSQG